LLADALAARGGLYALDLVERPSSAAAIAGARRGS
jgi:hypothetical protein